MIYVDMPLWMKRNGRQKYAHLVATTLDELHAFALQIGLGRHFFHASSKIQHYDISLKHYQKAIDAGAIVVSSKEIVMHSKAMMLLDKMKA